MVATCTAAEGWGTLGATGCEEEQHGLELEAVEVEELGFVPIALEQALRLELWLDPGL